MLNTSLAINLFIISKKNAMFLQNKQTGTLVEIRDLEAVIAPLKTTVFAQGQAGEEKQDPEEFEKQNLVFPSGESLPCCWVDENYRNT